MNDTLHNKKTENGILKALQNKEGNITTNLKQKADTLNDYFADVGKSLHDKLTSSNFLPIYSTNHVIEQSMFLRRASEHEVSEKIQNLKNSKSIKDFIPSTTLKQNVHVLAPVICKFINQSFSGGLFPNESSTHRIEL